MATPEKYSHIDFTPPKGVRDEAAKGLAMRREHGRGGTAVGIARARDLSNGSEVSPSTIRRMKAFFDRHASDEKAEGFSPGEAGYPSNGKIANLLWGGAAGYAWAKKVVRQMNAADESRATYSLDSQTSSIEEAPNRRHTVSDNVERRYLGNFSSADDASPDLLRVEQRADTTTGKPQTYLVGYAARFGKDSLLLGDFVERIAPTAFEIVEQRKDSEGKPLETRCLFNHSPDHLLGRFPTTMKLVVDERGLRYECLLPESRRDLAELVARGDLKGSSFSFVVAEGGEKWSTEEGRSIRTVTRIKSLLDCGPVTWPAYDSATVAVAKRSYDQFVASKTSADEGKSPTLADGIAADEMRKSQEFLAERRDCGRNSDGTFAEGNACAGGSSLSEQKGSYAGKGLVNGFNAGYLAGHPFTGALAGAAVGSLISKQSEGLMKAYNNTNTNNAKASKVADIFGDHITATHGADGRGGKSLTLSGGKVRIDVERQYGKKGVNAHFVLRNGEDPAIHVKAIEKSAEALGVNTISVAVGGKTPKAESTASALKKQGYEEGEKKGSTLFLTKKVREYDESQKPKSYRPPKKEASGIEKVLSVAATIKSAAEIGSAIGQGIAKAAGKDTVLKIAKSTPKVAKSFVKDGVNHIIFPRSIRHQAEQLREFYNERRGFCPTGQGGGVDNSCGGSGKYMEWKKGEDQKSPEKTKKAQEFIDKARDEQLTKGGKGDGMADEGGGVQTWSKGDHFPWVPKQVGSDSGYVQAVHPDGSKTEKYHFTGGDTTEAYKKMGDEVKAKKSKRALDVARDTIAFLRSRGK